MTTARTLAITIQKNGRSDCDIPSKNPTWWKRRSALERGLTVIAVSGVLLCIALAVALGVLAANTASCEQSSNGKKCYLLFSTMRLHLDLQLPSTAEALKVIKDTATIDRQPSEKENICFSPGCVHTGENVIALTLANLFDKASKVLENMDPDVEPCDDFYKFACGGFLKSTIIPDDKTSVNTFSVISDNLQQQLRTSIEEKSPPNEPRPFTLAKIFYKNCMNKSNGHRRKRFRTVARYFANIRRLACTRRGYSVDYFLDFSIGVDLKNSTIRIIDLDQASLGLSREYLSKGFADKIVQAYYNYMVDIAVILGADKDRAVTELRDSLDFEMKLANVTPTVQVEENEVVIVSVPSYIKSLEQLLSRTPKRVQANYVMWRAAAASVSYLTENIRKRQLQYSTALSGKAEREARWKECVDMVSGSLSISVGAMYVRKYFKEDAKKNALEMVNDIREEFTKILKKVDWMDEETKESALDKAASMSSHIAYPDELLDDKKLEKFYEKLELTEGNYLESILNLTLFGIEYSFSRLRKPVNKSDWITHGKPAIVNAFYSSIENSIRTHTTDITFSNVYAEFPAGILQGTFFNNDRPRYMNYGAIGFVIGHEITHGFDDQGRQFDKEGNLVDWWAPETKENYLERAECIVQQYRNYTVEEVGLKLNGINTQGENIADNGGIKEAYFAYKEWVKRNHPEQKLPGLFYTPEQMFWISAANTWCSKYRPETMKLRITTGFHSPGEFRVLGPFSNMNEFSKDFNCPVGSKMNPEKKCAVW
uniref:Uncharacterized protein n=1 Tax=Vespula pensylvanica TaxID=30213 RepID=A0A834N371_VESPE|nr:hypothetical protein H0235_016740 [Vespula pensylvanica]